MKAKPYVYKLTHNHTNKFYIGMRSANRVTAHLDIGISYFSSSKEVKDDFENYSIEILKEFDDSDSAFGYENELIRENFNSELIINKHFQRKRTSFSMEGFKRDDVSELNKKRLTKPKETRIYLCKICSTNFERLEFAHHPVKERVFCSQKCAAKNAVLVSKGKYKDSGRKIKPTSPKIPWNKGLSKETDSRVLKYATTISQIKTGTPAWNKGKPNPTSSDNGKNGAVKQSETVTGRRKKYREDGTWFWEYPKKKQ